MTKETNIQLFENRKVRSVWDAETETRKFYLNNFNIL